MSYEQNTDFEALEEKIGYKFQNRDYLMRALTHSSYLNERKDPKLRSNERMEFLGDSVLSIIVSERIFFDYPYMSEGELSKIRAGTVCEKALWDYASTFSLGDYLFMGRGEAMSGGRIRPALVSDAFEALIAAMYLDGGIEPVRKFVLPFVSEELDRIFQSGHTEDYKTMLQHFIQQEHGERLQYVLTKTDGPDHDPIYHMEARLNSNVIGHGQGKNKREAEQSAAYEALELFGAFKK